VAYCTFCNIISGSEPAEIVHDDGDVLVFRNRLRWLEVMLLAVPKRHMAQEELWADLGAVGRAAVKVGRRFCPNGFRLVSNFGPDALQSQPHAHVHVIGRGTMDAIAPLSRPMQPLIERADLRVSIAAPGEWPPVLLLAEPLPEIEPDALWEDMGRVGAEMVRLGMEYCPIRTDAGRWYFRGGFRLVSNFGWDALQAHPYAHLYLLGGDELGHYV
jgi:histidine triad (HIT) family protein